MTVSLERRRDVPRRTGPDRGLGRLARSLLAHRKTVGLFWLAIAVVGIALVGPIAGRLTSTTTLPGLPSYQAGLAILHTYGNGGDNNPTVVVVTLPPGQRVDTPAGTKAIATTYATLHAVPALRVLNYPAVDDRHLVSPNGRATIGLVFGGNNAPTSARVATLMRAGAPPGVAVAATNLTDLYNGSGGGIGVLGEVVVGAVGALIVLVVIFGSFLALVPLIIAAVSILGTFLALGAITTITDVSQIVEYLVALIGLGIAIDYSLLVVSRWREERDRGRSNDDAVVVAMTNAGRAVLFSGVTVAVGLFALIALPIPFLRSLGYGGLLIPLITVIAAITLLPVLLSAWGPRLDGRRRRRGTRSRHGTAAGSNRAWMAWTRAVIRHRLVAVAAAAIVLGVLLGAACGLRVGEIVPTSLARSGSAEQGVQGIEAAGFPIGVVSPLEILVPDRTNPAILAARLRAIPGVDTAIAPSGPAWRRAGTALVDVLPSDPTSSTPDKATIAAIRQTVAQQAPGAQVAGDGPEEADLIHAYYSRFPLIVAFVALISLLALTRAFRSVVLAVKAVLLNLISVGAACGALVLIWQDGYGARAIWGIPANGVVVDFVPLLVFAFLFGLSMDYEVFILSRIKEAHDAGVSTDQAVVEGLGRTGRLVTSAALILFFAFAALAAGPEVPVKVFATGMAVGVLLDATIVRALLVPALVSLLGERNWWLPNAVPRRRTQRHLSASGARPQETLGHGAGK